MAERLKIVAFREAMSMSELVAGLIAVRVRGEGPIPVPPAETPTDTLEPVGTQVRGRSIPELREAAEVQGVPLDRPPPRSEKRSFRPDPK